MSSSKLSGDSAGVEAQGPIAGSRFARGGPEFRRAEPRGVGSADSRSRSACLTGAFLEPALADLAEVITRRLQAGEVVDVEEYVARNPEWETQLRRLMPVLLEMAKVCQSLDGGAVPGTLPYVLEARIERDRIVDDFQILREVGRGGMGIVYEAEQRSLGRRVALKVLPLAAAMDPRALQRFQLEAQAAAWLQHPRIVPVYAVGTLGDVPYYAMQFIEGASLAELIAELRGMEGLAREDDRRPRRSKGVNILARGLLSGRFGPLPASEAGQPDADADTRTDTRPQPAPVEGAKSPLESSTRGWAYPRMVAHLGVQAAEALEYAHGQGILHRDVKPGNLLLDYRGLLWVTDFGLARMPGEGGLTLTGDVLGTLRYMSPEQALAKRALVDRRTDIYSLGLTLIEMLTLEPCVTGADRQEILRALIEDEPVPIRRLNPSVPVDLATILGKAICKDPTGRYLTAQHFADDLRRFLDGRTIAARPTGRLRRTWRWCRRRPLPAGLATGLVVAVIAGFVGVTWAWREAVRQRDLLAIAQRESVQALVRESRANRALLEANAKEQAAREQALRRFTLTREAVEQYYTGAGQDVLLRHPQLESLQRSLLSAALLFYDRLRATIGEGPDDPKTKLDLAIAYRRVGQIAVEFGARDAGLEALERARTIYEDLVRSDPTAPSLRRDLALCLGSIGLLDAYTAGREAEGMRLLERALGLHEALAAEYPDNEDNLFSVASTAGDLGYERARSGRIAEGLASLVREREILVRLVDQQPENALFRNQLALTHGKLGEVQANAGDLAAAIQSDAESEMHLKRLIEDDPSTAIYRQRLGQAGTDLGRLLCNAGRPAEALPRLERSLKVLEEAAAELPAVASYQRALAECHDVLGWAQAILGRRDQALAALDSARATLEKLIGDNPNFFAYQADLGENYFWTGAVHQDQGRSAEARAELRKARDLLGPMVYGNGILYTLARAEARLVPLTDPSARDAQAERAVKALRHAVAKGFHTVASLRADPSFDPLRARADFTMLLRDLQLPDPPFAR